MRQRPNSGNSNGSMYGRNRGGGGGGDLEGGGGRGGYNDTNANILEQQNNDRIYELSEQVSRLKGLAN